MAQISFDESLGREVEFFNRVLNSDPTNAVFVVVVLASAGLESDSLLRSYANLSDLLAGASAEVTNTGYARVVFDQTDLVAYTVDNTNHRIVLPFPDAVFTTPAAGDSWRKLIVCYDPDSTGGTDTALIPVSGHDLLGPTGSAVVPNGSNITVSFPDGLLVAS